jgi:hypothetical protein
MQTAGQDRLAIRLAAAWAGFAVFLFVTREDRLAALPALLALSVFGLGLAPALLRLHRAEAPRRPFPLFELTGLFYGVFFGASVFLVRLIRDQTSGDILFSHIRLAEISTVALALAFASLVLMFAAWTAVRGRVPWRLHLPEDAGSPRLRLLLWGLALGALAYAYVPWLRHLPSIGQLLVPVGYLAFGGFAVLWWRRRIGTVEVALYFLVVLPLWLAKFAAIGFSTPIVLVVIYGCALRFWSGDRLPWKTGLAAVTLAILIYPSQADIRNAIWKQGAGLSVADKLARIGEVLVHNHTSWPRYRELMVERNGFAGLANRLSFLVPMSWVVQRTPDPVPYWGGETYKPLFTSFVPRALWPGKPREQTGGAFGFRYDFFIEADRGGSLNLPWLTEMYANFGAAGVLLGMTLVGALLGFLEALLNRPGANLPEALVGSALLLPLFYQESNFSLMMGSFLPLTICLWLYFRVGLSRRAP